MQQDEFRRKLNKTAKKMNLARNDSGCRNKKPIILFDCHLIIYWYFFFRSPRSLVAPCHPQFMIRIIPDERSRVPKMTRKVCGGSVNQDNNTLSPGSPWTPSGPVFPLSPWKRNRNRNNWDWLNFALSVFFLQLKLLQLLSKTPYIPETSFL